MTWAPFIPIIAAHGLPFAERLFELVAAGGKPTKEQFAELRALSQQTARGQLREALARAGLDPATNAEVANLVGLVEAAATAGTGTGN